MAYGEALFSDSYHKSGLTIVHVYTTMPRVPCISQEQVGSFLKLHSVVSEGKSLQSVWWGRLHYYYCRTECHRGGYELTVQFHYIAGMHRLFLNSATLALL